MGTLPASHRVSFFYFLIFLFAALPLHATGTFTIAASPSSLSIGQGYQGTSTITTTISGGFNSSITLSASGNPVGVTVSFSPTTIAAPGAGSSTMTVNVLRIAMPGTYPITVTGNGGGVQQHTIVTLTVTKPGFTLSASPSSLSVAQGTQGTSTITSSIYGGFNAPVTFTYSGAPSGTTVAFNPTTLPAPGSGSSTMTITVGSSTPTGTYPITVTGNGGGATPQNITVTLTVTPPADYTISASPSSLSVAQGTQGTSTITTTISNGFNSSISLSYSGAPSGTNVTFAPNPIAAPGAGTSTMTITVGSSTPTGTYPITVTGDGGGIQHSTTVTLTVTAAADYTISASPSSLTILQGNQGNSTITTVISGGFNSSISLSYSGAPSGTNVTFAPNPIAAPGAGTSTMTISVGNSTPTGTYPITVTGNGGGIQHSVTVTLTVIAAADFTISASPTSLTIQQGNQGNSTITTTISGGFNNPISLSYSGAPTGTLVNFTPNPIPAPGAGSSVMSITVGSSTPTGTYPITVTGSSGDNQHSVVVTLNVTQQGQGSFTIAASPSSLSIVVGNQGTSTITTAVNNGFNAPIVLSASGTPPGVSVTFTPGTIPAPGNGTSTMTISILRIAKVGTYPITVTGTGGGIQQNVIVTLTITPTQDFSIMAVPGTLTIMQGQQDISTVTSTTTGGFNNSVSLSCSGAPAGVNITFNPPTIPAPGSGTSIMTVAVATTTATGNYTLTITATSAGLQRYATMQLTVTPMPNFVISSSPATVTLPEGNQGTSTVTTLICCNFNNSITLSASGAPAGTTASFSPGTIAAPGNGHSTLTLATSNGTPTGIYPITVTGSGGGVQHSFTVNLNVTGGNPPTNANFMEPYSYSLQSSFGQAPYSYQLVSGSLPPGLKMDSAGNITGTATSVGSYTLGVLVTDSSHQHLQQTSSYPLNVVIGMDQYGGLTAAKVPGCSPNSYFQLLKAPLSGGNSRWMFATPECNAFYQLSIYFADPKYILSQIMSDRYGNDRSLWATHTLNRMLTYGFNSLDIFYSTYMLPVGTWGYKNGASIQVPFDLYNPALVDVRQNIQNAGISEPMKDLCAGRDSSGFTGYCGYTLDIFDPKWQIANTNELNNLENTVFTDGFADSPWVMAISLGDSGNLSTLTGNGYGGSGVPTYPHVGMLVATTNFQQTTYSGGTYSDTNVYSKLSWVAYLQNKYGTIAALNAAWNTGGFYTAFGDDGGFGTGTGVLDEDGRHQLWFGKDYYNQVGMNSKLLADLNQFLHDFTVQAYGVQANTFRTYDTNHLFVCGTFGGLGEGGARPQVLQGLKDSGCNVQVWNWDSFYVDQSMAVNKQMYDTVGTPALIMYATTAQVDSDMSNNPQYGSFEGDFPTQPQRGQHYTSDAQTYGAAQGTDGDYYIVGTTVWGLTDDSNEVKNWGFISLSDNVYDGQCAEVAAGIDQWGYACGGEAANYGNYTDGQTQSNSSSMQQLILQILQH